jgi:hypothetical protein
MGMRAAQDPAVKQPGELEIVHIPGPSGHQGLAIELSLVVSDAAKCRLDHRHRPLMIGIIGSLGQRSIQQTAASREDPEVH